MIQNNFILFYHSQSPEAETLRRLNSGIVATIEVESPDPPRRRGLVTESVFATLKNKLPSLVIHFLYIRGIQYHGRSIPFSQSLRLGTLRIQDSFSFKSIFHSRQMNI